MRAARRIRKQLLGPGGREARLFFTPALVAGGLVVIFTFITLVAVGMTGTAGVEPSFATYCFFAGETGPLSIRTAFLVLVGALAANFLVLLLGWLTEANRDGWRAYLPWRLTAGLWAAWVLALVVILGAVLLRMPGPGGIVAHANRAFADGNGAELSVALARGVDGAEQAGRDHLADRDFGARFEAAVILRVARGRDGELDGVMRQAVAELTREVEAGARVPALTPSLLRMAASFDRLRHELPSVITTEGRQLVEHAQTPDAEFFRWWRIQGALIFP